MIDGLGFADQGIRVKSLEFKGFGY